MNPRALLKATASAFRNAGIPDPEVDAALLLSHVTGQPPLSLRLDMTTALPDDVLTRFDALVSRRLTRQPLQYLLHTQPFLGRDFYVDERVLIPRPETELLVEWALACKLPKGSRALDLCTGSGAIAWSLAWERPDFEITAVDISPEALSVASGQFSRSSAPSVPHFVLADVLSEDFAKDLGTFDLLLSNPPYIMDGEKDSMRANVLDYEPHLALFVPDDDALVFYRAIARAAWNLLVPGGVGIVECNELLARQSAEEFENRGFSSVNIVRDLAGKERFVTFVR